MPDSVFLPYDYLCKTNPLVKGKLWRDQCITTIPQPFLTIIPDLTAFQDLTIKSSASSSLLPGIICCSV